MLKYYTTKTSDLLGKQPQYLCFSPNFFNEQNFTTHPHPFISKTLAKWNKNHFSHITVCIKKRTQKSVWGENPDRLPINSQ